MNGLGLGYFVGQLATLIGAAAFVLIIGRLPMLRDRQAGVYKTAAAIVVLLTLLQSGTTGIHTDATLASGVIACLWMLAILSWGFRRISLAAASGWLRLGAVLSLLWSVPGTYIFLEADWSSGNPWEGFWLLLGPVLLLWLAAWAVRWVAAGFHKRV